MPQTLFAHLNVDDPNVAWEVALGRYRSVGDPGADDAAGFLSHFFVSRIRAAAAGKAKMLEREFTLDAVRAKRDPMLVSRLRGVYLFQSKDDAHWAVDNWGLGWRHENIAPIEFHAEQLTAADSDWITHELFSPDTEWMIRYWSGELRSPNPRIEVLGIGYGKIHDRPIRERAYEIVVKHWPKSVALFQHAAFAVAYAGVHTAAQTRMMMQIAGERLVLEPIIYMADFENPTSSTLAAWKEAREAGDLPPVPQDVEIAVPDLSSRRLEVDIGRMEDLLIAAGFSVPHL